MMAHAGSQGMVPKTDRERRFGFQVSGRTDSRRLDGGRRSFRTQLELRNPACPMVSGHLIFGLSLVAEPMLPDLSCHVTPLFTGQCFEHSIFGFEFPNAIKHQRALFVFSLSTTSFLHSYLACLKGTLSYSFKTEPKRL